MITTTIIMMVMLTVPIALQRRLFYLMTWCTSTSVKFKEEDLLQAPDEEDVDPVAVIRRMRKSCSISPTLLAYKWNHFLDLCQSCIELFRDLSPLKSPNPLLERSC